VQFIAHAAATLVSIAHEHGDSSIEFLGF